MSYATVDQKIDEAIKLLSQIRLRIRSEYDVINQERQRLGISPEAETYQEDTTNEDDLTNPDLPSLSSLKPIFAQLLNTVEECEKAISQNNLLTREFVLQIARSFMSSQKDLHVALDSTQIPELNSPFQGVGLAMKLALTGDLSQLGVTLGLLKQLPKSLVDAGYIQRDGGGRNVVVGGAVGVGTGPEMNVKGNVQGKPTQPTNLTPSSSIKTKQKTKLSSKEVKDLEKSTSFGKEDLKKLHVAFKSHDRTRTGRLDRDSFKQLVRSLQLFPGISDLTLENFFSSFDMDGSGTVEFPELVTCLSVIGKGNPEEKLMFMFDAYDTDRSGFLDRKEVMAVVGQMKTVAEALGRDPRKIEPFVEGVLRKADADGSGEISREEWIHAGQTTPSLLVLLAGEEWSGPTPPSSSNVPRKKPGKISPAAIKELEGKTNFGKEELKKLRDSYQRHVTDQGGLSPTEFRKVIQELRIFPGLSEMTLDNFFRAFDRDGSGRVNFPELATALSVVGKGTGDEKLAYVFDAYDADHSGVLERGEVLAVADQMKTVAEALGRDPKKIEPFIDSILKKADQNGDGTIARAEWLAVGRMTPSLMQLLAGGDWTTGDTVGTLTPANSLKNTVGTLTPANSLKNTVGTLTPANSLKKKPLKLTAAATKELQSKTAFGKKELLELEKMFKKVDKDKSGDLNKEEFKKLITELRMLPGVSDGTLDNFFKSFDVDGSGSVDFAELATALSVLGKGSGEEKLNFMFDVYDADRSGVLDAEEVNAVINQMKVVAEALGRDSRKMDPFIQNILKKAEGTDGRITKVEWMRVGQNTPSLLSLLAGGDWT